MQTVIVHRIRYFIALSWFIILMPGLNSVGVASDSKTLRQWLESIARSQRQQNFEGTFVYRNIDELVSLSIVHAAGPDGGRERLIVLNGPERHVDYNLRGVSAKPIAADRVAVRIPTINGQLLGDKHLDRHYELTLGPNDRVAGRATQVVQIRARDHYRYSFDLGVDDQTGLVLRIDRLDRAGRLIEQLLFTGIRFITNQEALALLARRVEDPPKAPAIVDATNHAAAEKNGSPWTIERLPAGFLRADPIARSLPASTHQRQHLIFSDGLAAVSVFIESFSGEPFMGLQRVGAVNIFGDVFDGHQITVVGDVPSETVKMIGQSVHHGR